MSDPYALPIDLHTHTTMLIHRLPTFIVAASALGFLVLPRAGAEGGPATERVARPQGTAQQCERLRKAVEDDERKAAQAIAADPNAIYVPLIRKRLESICPPPYPPGPPTSPAIDALIRK
jgi:hypothetical protein